MPVEKKETNVRDYYVVDLSHIVKVVWHRIWIIGIVSVLMAAIGFSVAAFAITPTYSSSIMLYVNNSSFNVGDLGFSISSSQLTAAQSLAKTYTVLLKNRTTLERILDESGAGYTWEELYNMIDSGPVDETEVLRITVTSNNPYEAETIANGIAKVLPQRIAEIVEGASMEVVDSAIANTEKVAPSITMYTAVGFILGAIISIIAIIIMALMDNTVHDEDYVIKTYDYPILAKVPDLLDAGTKRYGYYYKKQSGKGITKMAKKIDKKSSFFALTDNQKTLHKNLEFTATEQYKLLRTNLSFTLPEEDGYKIIGVTSSMRGEGKSTTAVNLSYVLAESGKKVLLIDGNLRIPSVAKKMKIDSSPGVTDLFRGEAKIDLMTLRSPHLSSWYILPSGELPPNPSELLGSKRMGAILKGLSEHFDFIVVDLPPANIVSDALAISKYITGMIVVIREDYTEKKELELCFRQLKLSKVNVLGCVMNETKSGKGYYRKYRYKRYYKYYKTYGGYDSASQN